MTISQYAKTGTTFTLDDLPDSQLLDGEQAGQILGVSPTTLSIWRSTGRYSLNFVKCGRLVRYRVGDIRAFIERRTRTHTSSGV